MQRDMHFYGLYALARAAGIVDSEAYKLAYASQYVDDAKIDDEIIIAGRIALLPTMTSHKALDYKNILNGEQWKVWVPFHFLPGNEGDNDDFASRMICRRGSRIAQIMMREMFHKRNQQFWPHLIGIAAHSFADTFSHYGFIGYNHARNKINSNSIRIETEEALTGQTIQGKLEHYFTRFVSNIADFLPVGHSSAGNYPDRSDLRWSYTNGDNGGKRLVRDNRADFLEACRQLFLFLKRYTKSKRSIYTKKFKEWGEIEETVAACIAYEGSLSEKEENWKEAIAKGDFGAVSELDRKLNYDKDEWSPRELENGLSFEEVRASDGYKFIKAAKHFRKFVLEELLVAFELLF